MCTPRLHQPPSAAAIEEAQYDDSVATAVIQAKKSTTIIATECGLRRIQKGCVVEVCALKVVAEVAYLKLRHPPAALFKNLSIKPKITLMMLMSLRLKSPEAWIKAETHTERAKNLEKRARHEFARWALKKSRDKEDDVNRLDGVPLLSMPILHPSA